MSVRRNEATVIDLRAYRQRRAVADLDGAARSAPAAPVMLTAMAPITWVPVVIVVPVWLIN